MASPRLRLRWSIVALLIVGGLWLPVVRRELARGWSGLTQPVEHWSSNAFRAWAWPWSASHLASDRATLEKAYGLAVAKQADLESKLQAAEWISRFSTIVSDSQQRRVLAAVVGYSPDPGLQSVLLNRGSNDAIEVGMAVIADTGLVVGKIVTAGPTTSKVLLLSDSQSSILARISNDARSPGVVHGERGIGLRIELVPKNDHLNRGQTVVTSGAEALIPPNLPIGTIDTIDTRTGDVFQQATVQFSSTGYRLSVVAVVVRP